MSQYGPEGIPQPREPLERDIPTYLIVPGGNLRVRTTLRYHPDDPVAVTCSFWTGAEKPVQWIFGRDLLSQGRMEPVGEGDVRVQPTDCEDALQLDLESPFGNARLHLQASAVGEFLSDSYALVSPESEVTVFHDAFDTEIKRLLSE